MTTAAERLQFLYDLSRRLATFEDLDELLRYATRGVRELFAAEGSSILLLDADRRELRFPVASMSESRREAAAVLQELRFPANRGVAGWVLGQGEAILVEDVAKDPRFYAGVDQATGLTTRTILAAPLRVPSGTIGVVEVVNPPRDTVSAEDVKFLDAFARDIAAAYEKAELRAQLRQEVITLRQLARIAGVGALAIGVLSASGALLANLAWAVPLRTLPTRPPFVAGVLAVVAGVALLRAARRRR
jgi:GAF domain-containing protein